MTQPRLIVPMLFAALALAAVAAGCSGSNGSGSLPASPGTSGDAARHKRHVGAVLRIHIPRKTKRRKRGAHYVSMNTRSITVGVQYVTASPWPALATQTLVADSQHCQSAGEGGGRNCSFRVQAYVGNNIFTFNEYASQTPSPQDTPLGTLTSPVTNIKPGDPALSFTLEGVVNSVLLAVPNPESTHDAASEVTQPVPIGTPSSFPLYVVPEDASGAYIVTDTFSSPITIKVSPANSGVSLSLNKQCAGDTVTATSVTLNCAADINNVTVKYDGTVTQTGVNAYVDAATLTATPQLASPAPHPASVALTSNLLSYQIVPAPGGYPYIYASNLALDPVSGKIAFLYTLENSNPTIVELDPAHPAALPVTQSVGYNASFVVFDAAGHLWTNDATSSALHCYSSIGAAPVTVGVSDTTSGLNNSRIAPDASGNIWYSGYDSNEQAAIGYFAGSCATASLVAQFLISTPFQEPSGLALAKPVGGNPGVGMVAEGYADAFYLANTGTPPSAPPSPAAAWPSGESPSGLVSDKAYNIYSASSGSPPVVNQIAAGTANIQTFVNLPPDSYPYGMDVYSGTQSAAQALAVLDGEYNGVALVNPAAPTTEPLEIGANDAFQCFGVSYDKNGGVWTVCSASDSSIWAYHPVVTSNWGIVPTTFAITDGSFQDVITVAEKSGVDNSPFTVIGNTNPSVIATSTPWPAPGPQVRRSHVQVIVAPAVFPHAIPITIGETGTSVITVSDKNGRTQSAIVQVNQGETAGLRRRHDRRRQRGAPQLRP